eukprot:1942087-Amphidinium_carterae.1
MRVSAGAEVRNIASLGAQHLRFERCCRASRWRCRGCVYCRAVTSCVGNEAKSMNLPSSWRKAWISPQARVTCAWSSGSQPFGEGRRRQGL